MSRASRVMVAAAGALLVLVGWVVLRSPGLDSNARQACEAISQVKYDETATPGQAQAGVSAAAAHARASREDGLPDAGATYLSAQAQFAAINAWCRSHR